MGRQFVVIALIFVIIGGLSSANDTTVPAPSPIEATNDAPYGPPTAFKGPISQPPSGSPEGSISAPPMAGGPVAGSPSLLDEEGFPVDPVSPPAPEIESPPLPVASTPPPSATPVAEALQSGGATTLKISYVVVFAVVGAFLL